MEFATNSTAAAIEGEEELFQHLGRLRKRDDGKPVSVIGVANSDGHPRLRITAHTKAEVNAIRQLLTDRKFSDHLIADHEIDDGDGGLDMATAYRTHPVFDEYFFPDGGIPPEGCSEPTEL
ncbi:MAG: hypothetical protein GAK39_06497 [Variovorax sp.]|nr:MAG: hypothetical protein GAK39_06497 [Variovorax sp.]